MTLHTRIPLSTVRQGTQADQHLRQVTEVVREGPKGPRARAQALELGEDVQPGGMRPWECAEGRWCLWAPEATMCRRDSRDQHGQGRQAPESI